MDNCFTCFATVAVQVEWEVRGVRECGGEGGGGGWCEGVRESSVGCEGRWRVVCGGGGGGGGGV